MNQILAKVKQKMMMKKKKLVIFFLNIVLMNQISQCFKNNLNTLYNVYETVIILYVCKKYILLYYIQSMLMLNIFNIFYILEDER